MLETKWVVSGTAFATLCWRRDLPTASCIFGAVLNALLGKVLKRIFNSSRPTGAALTDPGMPSSHAQSLFFFASYLSLVVDDLVIESFVGSAPIIRAAFPAACFGTAAVLANLRVRAGLHTYAQVSVGGAFGAAAAAAWVKLQPSLILAVRGRMDGTGTPAVVLLLVVGALVVGSAERGVARWLKTARPTKRE